MPGLPSKPPELPEDFDATVGALLGVKPPPSGKKAQRKKRETEKKPKKRAT